MTWRGSRAFAPQLAAGTWRHRDGRRQPALAALLLLIFDAGLPLTFYVITPHRQTMSLTLGIIGLTIILAGTRLSLIIAGNEVRIFETILWVFYYLFLGIAPMVQYVSQTWPGTTPGIEPAAVRPAALACLLSASALLTALLIHDHRGKDHLLGSELTAQAHDRRVPPNRLWILFGIFVVTGSIYYSKIGIGNIFVPRATTRDLREIAWGGAPAVGLLIWASTCMTLLSLTVGLVLNWRLSRPAFDVQVATVACVVLTLIVFNPVSNPRFIAGTGILAVLGALGAYGTLARFRVFSLALIASLLLVFPSLDVARYADQPESQPVQAGPMQALTTGDYDAFCQISNTWLYLQENGITWGRQFVGVLLFWVPRVMWPNKPEDTGVALANFRGYRFTNLSAPLPSEAMINFGWVGIVVICFLIGRLLLRLDQHLVQQWLLGRSGSTISYILPFYLIIVLRGSMLQATGYLGAILLSVSILSGRSRAPGDTTTPSAAVCPGDARASTTHPRAGS